MAFISWGVLPLFWKLLHEVASGEILAHRIFWSWVFVSLILLAQKRWTVVKQSLAVATHRRALFFSAMLININWFTFIWAVNSNHVVETSMGYYITPLFSVLLGVFVFRERLNRWQIISLCLASIGVLIMTVQHGRFPWIALTLTVSFGLYGFLKKIAQVDSLSGLWIETLLSSPFCLAYLGWRQIQGVGAFGHRTAAITCLFIVSGIITALPLIWFAQAAQRIPLSTVGFLHYLTPTISLFIGVVVFQEPFTRTHFVSFGCIWAALVIYSFSATVMALSNTK